MDSTTINFLESIKELRPDLFKNSRVLEVGSKDINGTVREKFDNCEYSGVDIQSGDGVDIVGHLCDITDDLHDSYDIILCMNVLEHDRLWRKTLIECCNRISENGKIVIVCPTKISFQQFTALEKILIGENQVKEIGKKSLVFNFWPERGGINYQSESLKHCQDDFEKGSIEVVAGVWNYIKSSTMVENSNSMRVFLETSMSLHHNVHMTSNGDYYSNPSAGEILECLAMNNKLNKFETDIKYSFSTGFQLCITLEKRGSSE
jgi:SAM-dependent methyltransferase